MITMCLAYGTKRQAISMDREFVTITQKHYSSSLISLPIKALVRSRQSLLESAVADRL